jgi:hypothetical protein
MQMPVHRIGPRVERRTEIQINKNAHQQHAAIDADTFDIGAVVIGRADPRPRGGHDGRA